MFFLYKPNVNIGLGGSMEKERCIVRLTEEERSKLETVVRKGKGGAAQIRTAQVLLHSDENSEKRLLQQEIADLLHCHVETVRSVRKRFVMRGFDAVLQRKKRESGPTPRLFDGAAEARLVAIACSKPPEGRSRWTLQLLSDRVVELNIVPHCTANTIHEVLKKTN